MNVASFSAIVNQSDLDRLLLAMYFWLVFVRYFGPVWRTHVQREIHENHVDSYHQEIVFISYNNVQKMWDIELPFIFSSQYPPPQNPKKGGHVRWKMTRFPKKLLFFISQIFSCEAFFPWLKFQNLTVGDPFLRFCPFVWHCLHEKIFSNVYKGLFDWGFRMELNI